MFLKSNIKILVIALLFISTHASSQVMSLNAVLDSIEKNNPLLSSFSYTIAAANTLASGASAWMAPLIGIGPYATPYSLQNDEKFFDRDEGSVLFFIDQDIPNPAKIKARQKYLAALSSLDSADYNSVKNELFTQAKTAYTDRYLAEKELKLIGEQMNLLNVMIQTAMNSYTYGQGDLPSIYKAQARQHSLQAMQAHDSSTIEEANVKLNFLMNRAQGATFPIDSNISFHDYNLSDLDTSVAFISQHRSSIIKANHNIESMQLENAVTLSAAKPNFNIRYEHYDMFGSRNTFSLMGGITIPIVPWSSKSYQSESLSELQQIDAMQLRKKNEINEARASIMQSLFHLLAEYEEVNRYENAVLPAYQKAYELDLISYRENTGGLLFTLMAWDDLKMAEEEYLYHLGQAYQSEIEYEHSIEKR